MFAKWNAWLVILLLGGVGAFFYFFSPILTPFVAAGLLAYLANPLVNRLMKFHLPRLLSVLIVFLLLFSVLGFLIILLIPLIEKQIMTFVVQIPVIIAWLQDKFLPSIKEYLGVDEIINIDLLKSSMTANWTKAGGMVGIVFGTVLRSGLTLIMWTANLVLIPVVTFYLLRDWGKLLKGVRNLLPRRIEPTAIKLAKECDEVLGAFFRGQFLVMLSLGVIYSIGLSLIGLPEGLLIGLVSGLLSVVPYLGFIVGILVASIAAFVQFGAVSSVAEVCLVYAIGQSMESMVLTPYLVGDRIGLHPVAVIFAVLAGGCLFGFFGVLLALPVASVIMVWVRYLNVRYQRSQLYQ